MILSDQPLDNLSNLQRIHYFDAMRAFAVMLGIVLHSAAGYMVYPVPQWPNFSGGNIIFDYTTWIIHMFRVPLFFFIAGFFAYQLWHRVASWEFLKNRFKRILIPFLICGFVFNLPKLLTAIFLHHLNSVHDFFSVYSDLGYTWFLEYLLIFYLVFVATIFLLNQNKINLTVRKLLLTKWHLIIFLIVPYILLNHYHVHNIPIMLSIIPSGILLLFYGSYFFLGVVLAKNHDLLEHYFKWHRSYFVLGTLAVILNVVLQTPGKNVYAPLLLLSFGIASFALFYLFVLVCMRFYSQPNKVIRYIAQASYWIYLIQVYLILDLQSALRGYNIFTQFGVITITTLLLSLFTYELFFRFRRKSTGQLKQHTVPLKY